MMFASMQWIFDDVLLLIKSVSMYVIQFSLLHMLHQLEQITAMVVTSIELCLYSNMMIIIMQNNMSNANLFQKHINSIAQA